MQEHTDDQTTQTTGRGYNRHTTDPEHAATGAATDLYSPVPGDDNDTRPGMVGTSRTLSNESTTTTTTPTTRHEHHDTSGRSMEAVTADRQQPIQTTPRSSSAYTMQSRSRQSDGGIMQKIQDNPLAVVAAATAGGMLVGRMMRNRSQRNEPGYLRAGFTNDQRYQGYRSPQPYQQPTFYPYQANPGYQGYQGYQTPGGYQGAPQYRADEEFRPEQGFQGRHENFPGGSNWD